MLGMHAHFKISELVTLSNQRACSKRKKYGPEKVYVYNSGMDQSVAPRCVSGTNRIYIAMRAFSIR